MSSVPLHALSVRQPYAYAILHMGKDIENRTWDPPRHIVGQLIWIHASLKRERVEPWELLGQRFTLDGDELPDLADLATGAIVGSVRVVGSTGIAKGNRWFNGPIGWVLVEPAPLETPVRCRGMLGVWTVPTGVLAQLPAAA